MNNRYKNQWTEVAGVALSGAGPGCALKVAGCGITLTQQQLEELYKLRTNEKHKEVIKRD